MQILQQGLTLFICQLLSTFELAGIFEVSAEQTYSLQLEGVIRPSLYQPPLRLLGQEQSLIIICWRELF